MMELKIKNSSGYFATFICLAIAFFTQYHEAKALIDVQSGSVSSQESFQIPELFKKGLGTSIDWNIERTGKFYGWSPALVGGSVTTDNEGNITSLNSDTGNGLYYFTANGLEGSWAVGGSGDFGHVLSYKELTDICLSGNNFHSVSDHRDWPDEGAHVMICAIYDKFRTIGCGFNCSHKNNYNYSFDYQIEKTTGWTGITEQNVNKCQDMKVIFTPQAEWFASLDHTCSEATGRKLSMERRIDLLSPATNFLACQSEEDCLSKTTESSIGTANCAKGVQQVPENFINNTQTTLTGNDSTLKCSNGKCQAYASGSHSLSANTATTNYFGECRADATSETVSGENINIPLVKITPPAASVSAITSTANINVINRPPAASVSFEKNSIKTGEPVKVTCAAVDPDSCVDKIVKIKWNCFNGLGKQENCFFVAPEGSWKANSLNEEIDPTIATNPYQTTAMFKVSKEGGYAVTCEAFDNDISASSGVGASGYGVAGIFVSGTSSDNPEGVVPEKMKFCAVLTDQGSAKTACGNSTKVNLKAYTASTVKADSYAWKCDKNSETVTTTVPETTCTYSTASSFIPELTIHDSESGESINCVSQAKVKVVGENNGSCSLGIREAGTNNDFVSKLHINKNTEVEAQVIKECLDQTDINWTTIGGSKISENKNEGKAKFKFTVSGIGSVGASIGNNDCGKAESTIKEEVNITQ